MKDRQWCMVGGWPMITVPYTEYAFTMGGKFQTWIPIESNIMKPDKNYEGVAYARPMTEKELDRYNKMPVSSIYNSGYECEYCNHFAVYQVHKVTDASNGAECMACGAKY